MLCGEDKTLSGFWGTPTTTPSAGQQLETVNISIHPAGMCSVSTQ